MTVIKFPIRTVATPAPQQEATATVYQFPVVRPRDRWDNMTWLTDEQKRANRAADAAGEARLAARKRFGKRLAVARAVLGISIEQAATAADVKPITFKAYESGAAEMKQTRLLVFVNHPAIASDLIGFLNSWLLEDGESKQKERDIIAYVAEPDSCRTLEHDDLIWRAIASLCRQNKSACQ